MIGLETKTRKAVAALVEAFRMAKIQRNGTHHRGHCDAYSEFPL